MVTSNAAPGYVAKISMLKLSIGSGMLKLISCMHLISSRRPAGRPDTVAGGALLD